VGHYVISVQTGTSMPADFDPNPVRNFNTSFGNWVPAIVSLQNPKKSVGAGFCRGTTLLVRTGAAVNSEMATFDLGPIGAEKLIKSGEEEDSSE
jgi:hypothetical protein